MTTTLTAPVATAVPVRPTARRTGPSLPALTALEIRKSLSTRSGRALAAGAVLLAPAATAIASASGEALDSAPAPLAVMGMLSAYIVMAIGVLSTAGEWSHRTVQTTYLLVPHRSRVLAAKTGAVALLGTVLVAVAVSASAGVLAIAYDSMAWDGAGRAMVAVIGAGAAFAVTGAGVGAALANSPASLTSLYLVILGVMPVLHQVKPEIAVKVDPSHAVLALGQGQETTTPILILAGWVVVSLAAGAILAHRRAVQ